MCATDCGRCDDCQATDEIVTWPPDTHSIQEMKK